MCQAMLTTPLAPPELVWLAVVSSGAALVLCGRAAFLGGPSGWTTAERRVLLTAAAAPVALAALLSLLGLVWWGTWAVSAAGGVVGFVLALTAGSPPSAVARLAAAASGLAVPAAGLVAAGSIGIHHGTTPELLLLAGGLPLAALGVVLPAAAAAALRRHEADVHRLEPALVAAAQVTAGAAAVSTAFAASFLEVQDGTARADVWFRLAFFALLLPGAGLLASACAVVTRRTRWSLAVWLTGSAAALFATPWAAADAGGGGAAHLAACACLAIISGAGAIERFDHPRLLHIRVSLAAAGVALVLAGPVVLQSALAQAGARFSQHPRLFAGTGVTMEQTYGAFGITDGDGALVLVIRSAGSPGHHAIDPDGAYRETLIPLGVADARAVRGMRAVLPFAVRPAGPDGAPLDGAELLGARFVHAERLPTLQEPQPAPASLGLLAVRRAPWSAMAPRFGWHLSAGLGLVLLTGALGLVLARRPRAGPAEPPGRLSPAGAAVRLAAVWVPLAAVGGLAARDEALLGACVGVSVLVALAPVRTAILWPTAWLGGALLALTAAAAGV